MADEFTKAALYGIKTFNRKVKEKIGMMKLIELLNEFLEEKYPKKNLVKAIEDDYFVNNWNDGDGFLCETIMSKKFGFIKWLVENNKIDKSKVFSFIDTADKPYEDILCLLALSDEPISDLISFLK